MNRHTNPSDPLRLVRLTDAQPPKLPGRAGWKARWRAWWLPLRQAPAPEGEAGRHAMDGLTRPPTECAGRAIYPLSSDLLASALEPQLARGGVQVIVAAPGWPLPEGLRQLAGARRCPVAEPGERGALRQPGGPELPEPAAEGLVIPRLEDWFLRHPFGLEPLRAALARWSRSDASLIVGCGSWAWSFLRSSLAIETLLPAARTFAPLSPAMLQAALRTPQSARATTPEGRDLFAAGEAVPVFFQQLAVYCRGQLPTAQAIWQAGLRVRPDHDDAALIIPPWGQLELPEVPGGLERPALAALQDLLIHDGLPGSLLRQMHGPAADQALALGRRHQLVDGDDTGWRVNLAALPALHRRLLATGMTVDRP